MKIGPFLFKNKAFLTSTAFISVLKQYFWRKIIAMSVWKTFVDKLTEDITVSFGNPKTFDTNWTFTSSRFRLISLFSLVFLLFAILFSLFLFLGPTKSWFTNNDVSIGRQKVEAQLIRVNKLEAEIGAQEKFIRDIQDVLLGKISADSISSKPQEMKTIDLKYAKIATTRDEGKLASKVKDDMRTVQKKENESVTSSLFDAPVKGVISEKFLPDRHPAVDIVCKKDATIKACLDGVIIYSGYTKGDGYFTIIDHGNKYISIYKHNKVNLKRIGQRVQLGDPIAIAGNTGENSTGPHLHFELWFEQKPIDPLTLMSFN
jgi:ABC-type multidrug transport system fused ATPase/permease subunit